MKPAVGLAIVAALAALSYLLLRQHSTGDGPAQASQVRTTQGIVATSPGASMPASGAAHTQADSLRPAGDRLAFMDRRAPAPSTTFGAMGSRARFPRATEVGYGAFIDEAAASGDPEKLIKAAELVKMCKVQDMRVQERRTYLHSGSDPTNEFNSKVLELEEDIQRRCQALTDTQKAQYLPMLEQAAKQGAPGAATLFYGALFDESRDSSRYPWLREELVADAARGEGVALHYLACNSVGTALSMKQRAAYLAAIGTLASQSGMDGIPYKIMHEHCGQRPDAGVEADPQLVSRLVAAVESRRPR